MIWRFHAGCGSVTSLGDEAIGSYIGVGMVRVCFSAKAAADGRSVMNHVPRPGAGHILVCRHHSHYGDLGTPYEGPTKTLRMGKVPHGG